MSRYYEESDIMKALDSNLVGTLYGLVLNVNMDEFLDGVPTADVVEVVRCKDCKWNDGSPHNPLCGQCYEVSKGTDDYCSWGERRENDKG